MEAFFIGLGNVEFEAQRLRFDYQRKRYEGIAMSASVTQAFAKRRRVASTRF